MAAVDIHLVSFDMSVVSDSTSPTVTSFSPSPGTITNNQHITFTVADNISVASVLVEVSCGTGVWETIIKNSTAESTYSGSSRTGIDPTYNYDVIRDAGWKKTSTTIRVTVVDTAGLITTATSAYTVSDPVDEDYYLMRAKDPDCVTLTYRTWRVIGSPDFTGAQYSGTRCGVSSLTDIVARGPF